MAAGNPLSFLHVDKPEIDLPKDIDPYDSAVYAKAGENLHALEETGALVQDKDACFYLYRQIRNGRAQTGLVCCAAIDDYINQVIKKHEHTRSDKEADRVRHVDACNANTGPIFLTYRQQDAVTAIQEDWIGKHAPVYDFVSGDGVTQQVWVIDEPSVSTALEQAFAAIDSLYIADGHHRCAAAVQVGKQRRQQHPNYNGTEEFNYFLAIAFGDKELEILDYNRVVADLNGLESHDFIAKLKSKFTLHPIGTEPWKPSRKHTFGMYLDGLWYALEAQSSTYDESDPVAQLDVSILQNNLLKPILGIHDPKTDQRIDFVGGSRGLDELERRVRDGMAVAFSLYPTTVEDLIAIADAEKIMPPKSTWFEPKLLSGIFIHPLD